METITCYVPPTNDDLHAQLDDRGQRGSEMVAGCTLVVTLVARSGAQDAQSTVRHEAEPTWRRLHVQSVSVFRPLVPVHRYKISMVYRRGIEPIAAVLQNYSNGCYFIHLRGYRLPHVFTCIYRLIHIMLRFVCNVERSK